HPRARSSGRRATQPGLPRWCRNRHGFGASIYSIALLATQHLPPRKPPLDRRYVTCDNCTKDTQPWRGCDPREGSDFRRNRSLSPACRHKAAVSFGLGGDSTARDSRHQKCFPPSTMLARMASVETFMANRRVGIWLIGACGGVGTTAALGLAALRRGLTDTTG